MALKRLTADELIRPIEHVTCGKCGRDDCVIYPFDPADGQQSGTFCATCSPAWSEDFFMYCTDAYRKSLGLGPLNEWTVPA